MGNQLVCKIRAGKAWLDENEHKMWDHLERRNRNHKKQQAIEAVYRGAIRTNTDTGNDQDNHNK